MDLVISSVVIEIIKLEKEKSGEFFSKE